MITLDCGCEYAGKRPNFEDPGLLGVAFWCPNGHEGIHGWTGTWPEPPPLDPRRTALVATAPDGTGEVQYEAPGNQRLAGIARRNDGTWVLLAKGRAYDSVAARAGRIFRSDRDAYMRGWIIVKAEVAS